MINLMQGDCLEIMKSIPDGSVDMVLTDPPYGTTSCNWDSVIPFEPMWEQLNRLIKPHGAIVLTACQPFTSALIMSNIKMFKYCWVWNKRQVGNPMLAKKQPLRITEDVIVFNSKIYKPQGLTECHRITTQGTRVTDNLYGTTRPKQYLQTHTNYPKNLIEYKKDRPSVHSTQKPVALMEYLIKTYTNKSETVLDFTMGSGSTGVAAKSLNREFIGIELDKTYFNIAKERIKNTNPLGEFL